MDSHSAQQWLRRAAAAGLLTTPWLVRWLMSGEEFPEIYFLLSMLLCTGLAALFLMPDLTRPLGMMVDSVFGTGDGPASRPPLDYRLARFYLKKERHEDALAEYQRIMALYPREVEPYLECIRLTGLTGGSRRTLNRYLRRGLKLTKRDPEMEGHLRTAWQQATARLQGLEK